jgi:RND family efflux transporter MFP subunit
MKWFLWIMCIGLGSFVQAEDRAKAVTVEPLSALYVYPKVEAPASIISMNDSAISAETSARIQEIPVRVGEVTAKGDVLIKLDDTDFLLEEKRLKIKLKQLRTQLSDAKSKLKRIKKLGKHASREKKKSAEMKVRILELDGEELKLAHEKAKHSVEKCTLRAPFRGLILKRLGKVGEFASMGKPLIQIMDIDAIEISSQVQTRDIFSLRTAKDLAFIYGQKKYPLILRAVVAVRDTRTRTQEVRLSFKDKTELPGTTGRVVWHHSSPYLPADMLVRRNKKVGIFLARDQRAKFLPLHEALEGRPMRVNLPDDTLIVTKGRFGIQNSELININP